MTYNALTSANARVTGMDYYAADYGRQSAARESGSEASTATQHSENRRALARYNPKRITEYEDIDKSAYKDDVYRKDFERMISDCRAGRINLIGVMYISRLTRRDPKESLPLLLELLRIGVVIVSATEGEFRDDDQNSVLTLINLIFRLEAAYRESANKSAAVRGAKRVAKDLGGYLGGNAPFGYDLIKVMRENPEDGRLIQIQIPVRNNEQGDIIRESWRRIKLHMNDQIETGKHHPGSLSGICIDFNREGVKTRGQLTGKKRANTLWRSEVLKRVLTHPMLAGYASEVIYGTRPDGGRSTKIVGYEIIRDPETTMPVVICEPTLDPAEWWQLQAWLGSRGQGRGRSTHITSLSGIRTEDGRSILTCECGKPMNSVSNHIPEYGPKNNRGAAPSYRCTRPRGAVVDGQHQGGNSINQRHLENYLAHRIFGLLSTAEGDDEIAGVLHTAARRYYTAREAPEQVGERSSLLAERADAVSTLRDIADNFGKAKSAIMRAALMDQESAASDRLSTVERRLALLDESQAQPLPIQEWLSSEISSDPMGAGTWWRQTSTEERREWFALFLDNVKVYKVARRGGNRWVTYDAERRVNITWAHELSLLD